MIVWADVDLLHMDDVNSIQAIRMFNEVGAKKVRHPDRSVITLDHFSPPTTEKAASIHKEIREFATQYGLKVFDVGEGVCHNVVMGKGLVRPGTVVVGGDSHSTMEGALGAVTVGSNTDLVTVLVTGKIWLRVPEIVRFNLTGKLVFPICAKDAIINILGRQLDLVYKAVEFTGKTVQWMELDERETLTNAITEAGAKLGFIEADERVQAFIKEITGANADIISSDPDVRLYETYEIDISELEPQLAIPHGFEHVVPISKVKREKIDVAFIGSCGGGKLEDLRAAARILRGHQVSPKVRAFVSPSSRGIYKQAYNEGLIEIFLESGLNILPPACAMCSGKLCALAPGEVCITASPRNFKGRMGSPDARIYDASPSTVAASAIEGRIADPRDYV